MKANRVFHVVAAMGLLAVNAWAADPQLTIYNQNFAVVRVLIPLDLKPGENRIQFTDTTAYLEPESVILRDPTGARTLQILEQNYRADPVSQQLLLSLYEGKTLDFLAATKRPQVGGAGQGHSQRVRLAPGGLLRRDAGTDHRGGRPVALWVARHPGLPRSHR